MNALKADSSAELLGTFTGRGITSRRPVEVRLRKKPSGGSGITFLVTDGEGKRAEIKARAEYVVNTLRNVTLGAEGQRLCIVEHVLCAAALWGLNDLTIEVDGPELPLGDGSSAFWLDLLAASGMPRQPVTADIDLPHAITVTNGDRQLTAVPAESFSITYLMDWNHPAIGRQWRTWTPSEDPRAIGDARTFGSEKEHKLLGLEGEVVSLTDTGFSETLRFPDEPVRHKLLDLLGDLVLSGVNPMRFKAQFIGVKSGHELDVQMARKLAALLNL